MTEEGREHEEARRVLRQVSRESTGGGRHLTMASEPAPDPVLDNWTTRVGRIMGVVIALALLVWFAVYQHAAG